MIKTSLRWFAPAALCIATLAAPAQTSPAPSAAARPDPLDANASVPRLVYRSSLVQARPAPADKPTTWREANDTVTRIGGWRAYAREAQEPASAQPTPTPTAPAAPAAAPAGATRPVDRPVDKPAATPQGHSGHKMP